MQVLTTARPHSLQVRDRSRPLPPKVSDAERQVMAALNACSTRLHQFAKDILAARVDGTIAVLSAAVSAAAADRRFHTRQSDIAIARSLGAAVHAPVPVPDIAIARSLGAAVHALVPVPDIAIARSLGAAVRAPVPVHKASTSLAEDDTSVYARARRLVQLWGGENLASLEALHVDLDEEEEEEEEEEDEEEAGEGLDSSDSYLYTLKPSHEIDPSLNPPYSYLSYGGGPERPPGLDPSYNGGEPHQ